MSDSVKSICTEGRLCKTADKTSALYGAKSHIDKVVVFSVSDDLGLFLVAPFVLDAAASRGITLLGLGADSGAFYDW